MNHRHSKNPSTGGGGMDKEHFGWGPLETWRPWTLSPPCPPAWNAPVVNAVKKNFNNYSKNTNPFTSICLIIYIFIYLFIYLFHFFFFFFFFFFKFFFFFFFFFLSLSSRKMHARLSQNHLQSTHISEFH